MRFASKKGGSRVPTRDLNANAFFSSGSLQTKNGIVSSDVEINAALMRSIRF